MPAQNTMAREIRSIQSALRQLFRSLDRLAPMLVAQRASADSKPRRNRQISPARRAALKLQGQYMGHMRYLKPTQKARVKKIRTTKGIRAAIAAAKKLGS